MNMRIMKEDKSAFLKEVEQLNKQSKFEEIVNVLTDEVLEKYKDAELYMWRGIAWYYKNENEKAIGDFNLAIELNARLEDTYIYRGNIWYDMQLYEHAVTDYSKAIDLNPHNEIAFNNRGLALFATKDYYNAIENYTRIIDLDSEYAGSYYNNRGNVWKALKEYDKAISDYSKAIERYPDFANAYYNRGLVNKELFAYQDDIKQDFEKYLELSNDKNDIWEKYARQYIQEINEKKEDPMLFSIKQLVREIKNNLLIEEECVHYTSISVLKKLILEERKFLISEGTFLNDPSEGKEFYNFLNYKSFASYKDDSVAETFSPKPFIGSFVAKKKNDDLNMWRFYGKEQGVEAKGCSITLHMKEFIEDIERNLFNENKEARQNSESDIKLYRVVYVVHDGTTSFYIPNLNKEKNEEFKDLMIKLRKKIKQNKVKNKNSLEESLNSIAFLFKRDAYKNENEVRLVVKGYGFPKKYYENNLEDKTVLPPRVYIELAPIKTRVEQITLGPKVDKVNEWASALYYCYKEEDKVPEILISHLPYK